MRASPVSLLSVIVLRKICLKTPHCTEWPLSRRCGNGQMCRTFQGLIKLTAFGLLLILLFPALYLHRQRWALVVNSITEFDRYWSGNSRVTADLLSDLTVPFRGFFQRQITEHN